MPFGALAYYSWSRPGCVYLMSSPLSALRWAQQWAANPVVIGVRLPLNARLRTDTSHPHGPPAADAWEYSGEVEPQRIWLPLTGMSL